MTLKLSIWRRTNRQKMKPLKAIVIPHLDAESVAAREQF